MKETSAGDELPKPPDTLGEIQDLSWKSVTQAHQLGDKSAVWKTTIGDMLTPAWWLEFYQGHAYVKISLLGFPDQIAPAILYGLGDIVSERLPRLCGCLTIRCSDASGYPGTSKGYRHPTGGSNIRDHDYTSACARDGSSRYCNSTILHSSSG